MTDELNIGDADANPDTGAPLSDDELKSANAYRQAQGKPPIDANGNEVEAPEGGAEDGDEKPVRPENVPEKFWDAEKGEVRTEELLKSYAELEKTRSAPKETPPVAPTGDEGATEFAALRDEVTDALMRGEQITDEQYAKFAKVGLDRNDIDAFVAGQMALGQIAAQKVFAEAGDEASYKQMIEWAKGNYSKEEVATYDRDIHSTDETTRLTAVRGLVARYRIANGQSAGRDVTRGGTNATIEGYKSGAEMRADMADPKYAKDPAFREEVARKVAAAGAAGVDLRR